MQLRTWLGVTVLVSALAGCATQEGMRVSSGVVGAPLAKYRNAMAVRSVSGGAAMDALTRPGVPGEPLKAALEDSLRANGYLASGAPKYLIDAQINNLDQPLIGLDLDVSADVTYTVQGAGAPATYPIKTVGKASFGDSPLGMDRLRIANERAMQANIREFLRALR